MSKPNLATSLRRRVRSDPMRAYDALPVEARQWLAQAALPWSAQSVLRLWAKALREAGGNSVRAVARLDAAQQRLLDRDARKIWGATAPSDRASAVTGR